MGKVEQIEAQILQLSGAEFAELRDWILERDWEAWDVRIGRDAAAGKLDAALSEAARDYSAGVSRPL